MMRPANGCAIPAEKNGNPFGAHASIATADILMHVRLAENFRAVFDAPYYAAQALGLFAQEGVEIEFRNSSVPGDAVKALLDGDVDITWGGPMRVMKARDQDASSPLVCFCEVVARDPFFLVGRGDRTAFALTDLPRLRFATVSEVPTPWMCLQHDLRQHGIDPDGLARVADRPMGENLSRLSSGELDVVQLFEPFVSMALQQRAGDILYAASARGPTVYTAFIASRDGVAPKSRGLCRHDARDRPHAAMARRAQGGRAGRRDGDVLPRRRARPPGEVARALSRSRHLVAFAGDLAPGLCAARRQPGVRRVHFPPTGLSGLRRGEPVGICLKQLQPCRQD